MQQVQGYALPTKCNYVLYNRADVESASLHLDATLKVPVRPIFAARWGFANVAMLARSGHRSIDRKVALGCQALVLRAAEAILERFATIASAPFVPRHAVNGRAIRSRQSVRSSEIVDLCSG